MEIVQYDNRYAQDFKLKDYEYERGDIAFELIVNQ
jgi:hypothetical protein